MINQEIMHLIEEVFFDGFGSSATYNDVLVTDAESEYQGVMHYYQTKVNEILTKHKVENL